MQRARYVLWTSAEKKFSGESEPTDLVVRVDQCEWNAEPPIVPGRGPRHHLGRHLVPALVVVVAVVHEQPARRLERRGEAVDRGGARHGGPGIGESPDR